MIEIRKEAKGYAVFEGGELLGTLRRPEGNVFASDAARYWDAFDLDGRKRGTGANRAEAASYLARKEI